ncbi:MAG TPA: hypothetical protein VFP70_03245 [Burkholderiales bacterium]|nr:hypothetical protein [Burkholderiales bacterium]
MAHLDHRKMLSWDEARFDARDVLTICTGLIPDIHRLPDIYRVLAYMTGGTVRMSEFGTAMLECQAYLLHDHPELARLRPPRGASEEEVYQWLEEHAIRIGGVLPVRRH